MVRPCRFPPVMPIPAGWRGIVIPLLALGLAACGLGSAGQGDMDRKGTPPASAAKSTAVSSAQLTFFEDVVIDAKAVAEAPTVMERLQRLDPKTAQRIDPVSMEFFRNSQLGKEWLSGKFHRAIAFGHPASRCPYYTTTRNHSSREHAVADVLGRCLAYVSRIRQAFGEPCLCRVAAVDDILLGAREGFDYRSLLPTLLFRAQRGSKDFTVKETGFLEFDGRTGTNQPIRMLDRKGDTVCSGTYSTRQPAEGQMEFTCRDERGVFVGAFRVLGLYAGRAYGFASARSENAELYAMFGLSEKDFTERWREVSSRSQP